jgi:hypothetical protein
MPDATITSTASTFGTITGTFSADQSTVTGTITGIITGTLSGSVGVPGQQGPTGPQGPQGEPGEGVPVGGTAGQFLTKIDGTNYNTDWTTLNLSAYLTKAGNLEGLTDLATARSNIGLGSTSDPGFNTVTTESDIYVGVGVPGAGIIFGDSTQQSTAFLGYSTGTFNGIAVNNSIATTPAFGDNDTSIATTAFVQAALAGGTAVAKNLEVYVRNQTGSTVPAGSIVYISGATGNRPLITLAQANNDANSAQTMGFTKTAIANNGFGYVIVRGELENIDTSGLTEGVQLYLSPTTAGTWTTTKPSAPQHLVYVGIVVRAHPTQGVILVAVQNGYELNELHDVKITSVSNGQVLKYDSAQGLWVNGTDVGGVAWGDITGTLSNQTDLQSALDGKYSTTNPAGYITSSALTPYLTSATAASTYQTIAGMSSYLTTSAAASTYYPLSGNPSGFLTSSSLTGYATESWVTTALGSYLTTSAASSTYLSKADNLASVASTSTARSNLGLGSLDTPTFAGVNVPGSGTSVANLGATSLTINQQGSGQFTIQPSQGIVFPDTTIQTTAVNATVLGDYLTKAGNLSGLANTGTARTNLGLGTMATANASDYSTTTVANGLYYPLSSNPAGYLVTAPVTSVAGRTGAITLSNTDISGLGTLATVNDAPSDGSQYARKNGAWDVVTGGGSSYITSVSSPLAVSSGNLTVDLSAKADLASPTFTGTPSLPTGTTAVTQTLGDNSTKIATTAFVIANAGGGGGGGGVDIQTFGSSTTSGTFTWTKPAGAKWVKFILIGGGGGGASGARQATTVGAGGGGGGCGGTSLYWEASANEFGSTETVTVGSGGTGANSNAGDNTNGSGGIGGNFTIFGPYRTPGGAAGNGGTSTVGGTGGTTRFSLLMFYELANRAGGTGGFASNPSNAQSNQSPQIFVATGGGGGAGRSTALTSKPGAAGGSVIAASPFTGGITTAVAGGSGGNTSGAPNGSVGVSATSSQLTRAGTGGGGGAFVLSSAGGTGGAGGWPGGGGGGGSASDNGFASGAGGAGANGFAVIITYF